MRLAYAALFIFMAALFASCAQKSGYTEELDSKETKVATNTISAGKDRG